LALAGTSSNLPASDPVYNLKVKTRFKWLLGGAGLLFAALQLTNPARTNPSVAPGRDLLASNAPPAEVAALLRAACYDCHSFETKWPWYSRVAPMSWLVADHVNEGRERLNFSNWPHDDPQRAAKRWNRISDEVGSGDMPLPSYAWIHPQARLPAGQREFLVTWAEQEARRLQTDAGAEARPPAEHGHLPSAGN
jgi:hypothetical protein